MKKAVYYIKFSLSILVIVASNYAFIFTESPWKWGFSILMGVGLAILLHNEGKYHAAKARREQVKKLAREVKVIAGDNCIITCYYNAKEKMWMIGYENGSSEPLNDIINRNTK